MIPVKIESLLIKYLTKSATIEDLNILNVWIEVPANKSLFKEFVENHYAMNYSVNNLDSTQLIAQLLFEIRKSKKKSYKSRIKVIYKYAAVFVGIIGLTYIFMNKPENSIDKRDKLIIAEDDITLELENGNVKIIDVKGAEKIIDKSGKILGTHKKGILNYVADNLAEKLVYNKLSIPNGKKFQIVLSDGTEVYLNAGTSIKYPVKFIKGASREVFLLSGEAYFDVSKDTEHPFIVHANTVNVRVLGTEFNISSYPEDLAVNTVLVEGAVSLYKSNETFDKVHAPVLSPGYKASWDKRNGTVSINKVDTAIYIGWKNGKLIFKNTEFKSIIKKLERHYNVSIVNRNKELNEQYFDATFDIETIEEVLNSFNKSYKIEYTINNNQIIIN